MEGLRKAKSSSTMGKSDIEIFDITDFEVSSSIGPEEQMDTVEVVTETDNHSINKNTGSVTIEECENGDAGLQKPETVMESAESWDNISQYLDKEDRGPNHKSTEDKETSTPKDNDKKRKLSIESSHSRLSQTKSAIMKTLSDTKKKLKVPKLTITASKIKKPKKTKGSPTEIKKETTKKHSKDQTHVKDIKPTYIHIPLKPPEGETDEFSYLEFGEKRKDDEDKENEEEPKKVEEIFKKIGKPKRLGGFKSLVKQIQESKLDEIVEKDSISSTPPPEQRETTPSTECVKDEDTKEDEDIQMDVEPEDISKTEFSIKTKSPSFTIGAEDDTNDEENDIEEVKQTEAETKQTKHDIFDRLFHASASKKLKEEDEPRPGKDVRSKSVEPERKRKYSLESSYSRKSLSKLSLMKKLKEASEKIKSKLSRSDSKISKVSKPKEEKEKTKVEDEEKTKVKKNAKKLEPLKTKDPVYIHIPLKPPEGENDEFSYLSEKRQSVESELSSTPDSPSKSGVQFIMVTAPSDDEILDYNSSDVPETPSSENKLFFANKVTELKQLAKEAVDVVALPGQKLKLDSVEEDANGENLEDDTKEETAPEIEAVRDVEDIPEEKAETKKITVDVEDGLNETEVIKPKEDAAVNIDTIQETTDEPELKSSMKGIESPVIKKKVSFKRRSKNVREGSYEDVRVPESNEQNLPPSTSPQVVAVVEKQHLEQDALTKQEPHVTFAEEQKQWSDIIDHEYEPVNPPPDDFAKTSEINPTIYITDTDYDTSILPLGTVTIEPVTQNKNNYFPNESIRQPETASHSMGQSTFYDLESTAAEETAAQSPEPTDQPQPSNFQAKLRRQSANIKAKFHNIKKPKFNKPEFKKITIEKPKFNIPKIPDTAKINLPSFSLGRRKPNSGKRSLNDRKLSTEVNDGDSKKQFFNFSTYPRIFKKKQKPPTPTSEDEEVVVNVDDIPAFATVPRNKKSSKNEKKKTKWGGVVSIRVPLHSEDSMDQLEHEDEILNDELNEESYVADKEALDSSHIRYDEDIDIDDEYDRENNEIEGERDFVDRWNKGMFNQNANEMVDFENFKNSNYKVTDLDSPDDKPTTEFETSDDIVNTRYSEFEQVNNQNNNAYNEFEPVNNGNQTRYSSGSSFGGHRRGVLEEIDSDEFIWRPKGISQEHINMFLSPEMREAFQPDRNTLLEMEKFPDNNDNLNDSRRSLPEETNKRKPMKKPKRVKTPHTSNDQIAQSEELTDDFDALPPSRPKRRSRRKKHKNQDDVIPYRETIPVEDDDIPMIDDRLNDHQESLGILGDDEQEDESFIDEIDDIEARLQEEIREHTRLEQLQQTHHEPETKLQQFERRNVPPIPPRKPKSIKSLNLSENDSIFDGASFNRAVSEDMSIDRNDLDAEIEAIRTESKIIIPIQQDLPPRKPTRTRSQNLSPPSPDDNASFNDDPYPEPCIEPSCVQDIRDPMGYAIIDKSKIRDPPLPPPRLPPRPKRASKLTEDTKFFTVPRSSDQSLPVRPLRNYSTLGQIKKSNDQQNAYENKENIDLTQYVEIEDEPSRDLQSGEVVRKMKDRPLPAPPRPPRKSRPLKDITSLENIPQTSEDLDKSKLEETEVSTQTEPLPDDFICDELVQEPTDKIIIPSTAKDNIAPLAETEDMNSNVRVERHLITPTFYTYEETVTHGSMLVEPLNGAKILPDSEMQHASKERVIPMTKLSDEETSSIPEDFKKLSDFPQERPNPFQNPNVIPDVIRTQKLQVSDLDVDTLNVNKLVADKIICSDIESDTLQTTQISSNSSALKISDITLPPGVIEEIIKSLSARERTHETQPAGESSEEKKTPTSENLEIICEESELLEQEFEENLEQEFEKNLEQEFEKNLEQYLEQELDQSLESEILTENIEIQNIIDENNLADQSSVLEEVPDLVQIPSLETDQIEQTEADKPPVPPPRTNSEHTASRLEKELKPTPTSPPEGTTLEPEVDDEPPPRPPEPQLEYIPSQPPASFYALKAQKYVEDHIPVAPRRKRPTRSRARSRSSSEGSSPTRVSRRLPRRNSEVPLAQLSGQLIRACGNEINNTLKRLITYVADNVLGNVDGTQDINVMILIVLVLIAGLILLGYGDEKTVVHLHHWEYFNPPKDL